MQRSLVALIQWFQRKLDQYSHTQSPSIAAAPGSRKLTREDVLNMIEKNGGPEGLDLSGQNMRDIDLSGVDLRGANLSRAALFGANLCGAFLEDINFERAKCWRANMSKASLWAADLHLAELNDCDLREASLVDANFQEASMLNVKIAGADLRRARFSGTRFSLRSLQGGIVQENESQLRICVYESEKRLAPFRGNLHTQEELEVRIARRHQDSMDIYRTLKNNFLQIGQYDDASWAYFKERKMERKTFYPGRARRHYGHELPAQSTIISPRWWLFYFKYCVKWLLAWINELSSGYGERPIRVVLSALAVISVFSYLYWLSAGVLNTSGESMRWLDYLQYSLAAFSTIGFPDLVPVSDVAKLLTSFEALLGISALALLMFALGNRISRS